MIVVEKLAKSLIYSDMSLLSKHCSSIYFRCMTAVLDFTLLVTVMLTDLTSGSAPDDESIDIEYCQKNTWKSIADAHIDTANEKYRRYYWLQYQYSDIDNPGVN